MSHIDKGAVVPALQLGHRVAQRIQEQIVGGQDIALQVELDGRLRLVQRIDDALHVLPFDLGLGDVVTDAKIFLWLAVLADERGDHRIDVIVRAIGRASCRERLCQYVSISVYAVALTKQTQNNTTISRQIQKKHQ